MTAGPSSLITAVDPENRFLASRARIVAVEYRDERDLNIYTDGSSYQGPRRGGVAAWGSCT